MRPIWMGRLPGNGVGVPPSRVGLGNRFRSWLRCRLVGFVAWVRRGASCLPRDRKTTAPVAVASGTEAEGTVAG